MKAALFASAMVYATIFPHETARAQRRNFVSFVSVNGDDANGRRHASVPCQNFDWPHLLT